MRRSRVRAAAVAVALLLAASGCAFRDGLRGSDDADRTTIVLVRHAEKRLDEDDPRLTALGERRARWLAKTLAPLDPDRLFVSEYRRTRQTLEPLARRSGRALEVRPARDVEGLAAELRALPPGSLAVVAGHSNTVPAIARALGAVPAAREMPETVYDRMLVVVFPREGVDAPPGLRELPYFTP